MIPINDLGIDKNIYEISEAIRLELKARNMSIKALARELGTVSHAQIARILNCQNYNISTLIKVINHLEMDVHLTSRVGGHRNV